MQLRKHTWRRVRSTSKFTEPEGGTFHSRYGKRLTFEEHYQQLASRRTNPHDTQGFDTATLYPVK